MSGRHVQTATSGRARIWLAGLGLLLVATIVALFATPAGAAAKTINSQLSLSGLASADNPVGGSQLGVHPGDSVAFKAAGVPTAGLEKLGLGGLVDGLLDSLTTFQITANFAGLPGGKKNTVLSGATKKTFAFPKIGTYHFTWTAQRVTLLGIVPIDLDGNQLKGAGIKLNASNQYVGTIVVAKNPPPGGLSVQVPSIKVAPSIPIVGQLPTLSIPGVSLPTIGASVPNLNPGGGSGATTSPSSSSTTSAAPSYAFTPPALSVPQQIVPQGSGGGGDTSVDGGNGGLRLGIAPGSGSSQLTDVGGSAGTSAGGSTTSAGPDQASSGKNKTIDLASSSGAPSGQLPVLLAILAVIVLAMVAGIYSRLYLLGRKGTSG